MNLSFCNGNLMQKVQAGVTVQYLYGGGGAAPLAEFNANTGEWTNHVMVNGEMWEMETPHGARYLHKDPLGNVIALSDENGNVTDTFEYDPFGKQIARTGTTECDYGFIGGHGVRKLPNGQLLMGRRQYDPSVGRFTTADPIGFAGGDLNLYRYGMNNPMKYIDPEGKQSGPYHPHRAMPSTKDWVKMSSPEWPGVDDGDFLKKYIEGVDFVAQGAICAFSCASAVGGARSLFASMVGKSGTVLSEIQSCSKIAGGILGADITSGNMSGENVPAVEKGLKGWTNLARGFVSRQYMGLVSVACGIKDVISSLFSEEKDNDKGDE